MTDKEFKRRIKKMRKHTAALRETTVLESDVESLDTIDIQLSNMERRKEDPDVQALAHGVRRGPQAVKG
jgi:hypothetical protein